MRVVVAPDSFKGSLSAVAAAQAIALGVRDALPDAQVVQCPVADGGEGTLDVLLAAGARAVDVRVRGPLDDEVAARYVTLDGAAYVESARACGLGFVEPSPATALRAHTFGVGQLLAHALAGGARRLVLTVGGTASTDGGAGMLAALGAKIVDTQGEPAGLGGRALAGVSTVEFNPVGVPVHVATDVTNPLLGPDGAAAVFGPQKGAGPAEVAELEAGLRHWADCLRAAGASDVSTANDVSTVAGAGAGGGVAAGAIAGLGARVSSGFDLLAGLTGLADAIAGADLVLTGEGALDAQSLAGKAPAGVAALAAGVPVLALAGRVELTAGQLAAAGIAGAAALVDAAPSAEHARTHAAGLLRGQTAALLAAHRIGERR